MSENKEAKKAKKAEKKAAKANGKKGEKAFKVIVAIILVIAVVAELGIGITMNKRVSELTAAVNATATEEEASNKIDVQFSEGTYGGIEFKTEEDVVNYYNEAYNKTKAKTAQYKDADGNTQTFYAMVGTESLTLKEGSLLVNGAANSMINNLAPGIIEKVFSANVNGLPPCANRDPNNDIDDEGASLMTSRVVPEDVAGCSVTDNGDGTITLLIVPALTEMSSKGKDAQGHFFNSLGALDSVIDSIGVVSWASGSTAENCKAIYDGGKVTVKIDTASGEIVEADYNMVVNVSLDHATVTVLKDKSASLTILYDQHFPADDQYLMDKRQLTRL
ncbi:MAG: hypothetical protein K2N83_03490 [Eubacterium sp.]|nr:hypothetical protein [Eubacterium sp.]